MNKKILVADDDPSILEALQMLLEDEGYNVETSNNGASLIKAREEYPDLILLDIWMSGMDGRDICRQLKNNDITKNIPVILVSANKDTEQIAKDAGADGFIAKPFEMEDLLAKVKEHVGASD